MKTAALSLALLFASTCFAQTKSGPPLKTMKAQLAQAQSDLQASELARVELDSKNKELESKNKELEARNAELTQKMEEIKKAATELLQADAVVYPAASKLQSDYGSLVQKYNSLLDVAQNLDAQLRAANSRQQRFNNALALYNAMPKYTPPQQLQIQLTNCNALPALCVH
jgi:chromosome segregation ATPase